METLTILTIGLPLLILLIYLYLAWNFNYWQHKGIPYVKGGIPFGNIKDVLLLKKTMAQVYDEIYQKFPDKKVVGFFKLRQPMLLIRDPDLIKSVLVTDFTSFHDNDFNFHEKNDPAIAMNPFATKGDRWKKVRTYLTQPLTPAKLKGMAPLVTQTCKDMVEYIDKNTMTPLEAKYLSGNFTNDVVASFGFGHECNSFKNVDNEFRKMSYRIINGEFLSNLALMFAIYAPFMVKLFKLRIVQKEVHNFFSGVVQDIIDYRQKNNVTRNDFLQKLINDYAEGKKGDLVGSIDDLTAHCLTFFLDGYNTTSIVMSFCLFELALHPECQTKLREEIKDSFGSIDDLDYTRLQSLNYMQLFISEVIRLHPPFPIMNKVCTKSTTLNSDGFEISVESGTPIAIPVLSLHMDKTYFDEPEKFLPERHTEEACAMRRQYSFLPFGGGPRICMGMKFAELKMKMGLAAILMNFEITAENPNLVIEQDERSSFLYLPKGDLMVKFRKL